MSSSNFKVLELIGKGSFASVYKVMRKTDGKVYAMKRVKISKMSRKEISDTLNEVRFLASIQHPNVVGFYEAFIDNNDTELCIIMEYCGCGDLSQKVERYKKKRQYISEPRIWGYIIQMLQALQALHSHGICHRDLKAANTFLSEDGSIKVGDMNVSKMMSKGNLKTQIGTPYYMAPEIWNNQPYNEKCDIWSLGCMIYEMAALRPPFLGDSFPSLKRAVVIGRFAPIPTVYSDALSRVINAMIKVNPRERPTAAQILSSPQVHEKFLSFQGAVRAREQAENPLLNTIKVPQALRKLNDVLPKPCYPEAEVSPRVPPLPPLPSTEITASKEAAAPITDRSQPKIAVSRHPHPPTKGGANHQYQRVQISHYVR